MRKVFDISVRPHGCGVSTGTSTSYSNAKTPLRPARAALQPRVPLCGVPLVRDEVPLLLPEGTAVVLEDRLQFHMLGALILCAVCEVCLASEVRHAELKANDGDLLLAGIHLEGPGDAVGVHAVARPQRRQQRP